MHELDKESLEMETNGMSCPDSGKSWIGTSGHLEGLWVRTEK